MLVAYRLFYIASAEARLAVHQLLHRAPLLGRLLGQRLQRRHEDGAAARRLLEHPQDRKLGADRLAGAGGRADEHVVVGVEEGVEGLRLDRVEVREGRGVEGGVGPERRDGERLEVEQLGVRRVLLREDQVAERDGEGGLGAEPALRHDADEVLRRQRVVDRDGERERVVVLGEARLEDERLVVEDVLLGGGGGKGGVRAGEWWRLWGLWRLCVALVVTWSTSSTST